MKLWDRLRVGLGAFAGVGAAEGFRPAGMNGTTLHGVFDRGAAVMDAADEVAAEQRGRVMIVARQEELCRWLLAQLRQEPPLPPFQQIAREGFFTLLTAAARPAPDAASPTTPAVASAEPDDWAGQEAWGARSDPYDFLQQETLDADLILYLSAAATGWHEEDARLFSRLRTPGAPVLPVMVAAEAGAVSAEEQTRLRQRLGLTPAVVTMTGMTPPPDDAAPELVELVNRMLALRPRLAIPLAQEASFCRHAIATRVVRTGALMTLLVGAEPIPLLDLPLQVALQWKVALQLAAIFGRPGLDVRSREMASTVGVNIVVRTIAQQLAKIVPVIGWLLSGLLSGLSTWLLGHALLRYYENDQLWNWDETKQAWQSQTKRVSTPLRSKVGAGATVIQRQAQGLAQRLHLPGRRKQSTEDGGPDAPVQDIPLDAAGTPATGAADAAQAAAGEGV